MILYADKYNVFFNSSQITLLLIIISKWYERNNERNVYCNSYTNNLIFHLFLHRHVKKHDFIISKVI